jgi:hypothetical protein
MRRIQCLLFIVLITVMIGCGQTRETSEEAARVVNAKEPVQPDGEPDKR